MIRKLFVLATTVLTACSSPNVPLANIDARALLAKNDLSALDRYLNEIQRRFEEGRVSEIELRNSYRPFYELDVSSVENLRRWVESNPKSYPALLAEGIYLKRQGLQARGEKFIGETSSSSLATMNEYFSRAKIDLTKSLSLTGKPYLSVYHLLDVDSKSSDHAEAENLMATADKLLPNNCLARDRYFMSLMPRWGGSYDQAEAFITKSKLNGVSPQSLLQLQAILNDDQGDTSQREGDNAAAMAHYSDALTLGKMVGGDFRKEWLPFASYAVCNSGSALPPQCR